MKNIHLFETKEAYDEAKSGLILPTVSYIKENKVVEYNPHHDYVEIAGIKWATMNVGAKSITDYGLYFQWGDTQGYTADQVGTVEGKKKFSSDDSDYKWYSTSTHNFAKYNTDDGITELELVDDAVHAAWGGYWRMPTTEEFQALGEAVTTGWTDDYQGSGVNGLLCTAKDGSNKTLFFPACGNALNGSMNYVGSNGNYWSSSLRSSGVYYAYIFGFRNNSAFWDDRDNRYVGRCVRGVLAEN